MGACFLQERILSTALVLLDLQRGILSSPAISWDSAATPASVVNKAKTLLHAAREAGILIVHVGVVRSNARGTFDDLRTSSAKKSSRAPRDVLALAAGSPDIEFVLDPMSGEEIVYKMGVSGFQGTRLDMLLRNSSVQDVILAGVFTHMVVDSTARQGFDLGYRVIVAADACCAPAAAPHQNALATSIPNFAVVLQSQEIAASLMKGEAIA
jgi:nicotinamidase-related amidase